MTSIRHKSEPEPPNSERTPRDAYLDAARACILDIGWRRTTLTEVARRAGVSRMTIYRSWSDMQTLLADLMTREWGELVATTTEGSGDRHPGPERLADALVRAVRALRENDLFLRVVELDPELILPYLFARRGRSQELVLDVLTASITTGQEAGTVRRGDPDVMARALLLALHGFTLSLHTMVDDAADEPALEAELRLLLEGSLAR